MMKKKKISSLGCRERFDFSRDQSCATEAWWTLGGRCIGC